MTRFARAKGSKASNERVPNDSTPWHIMKQQLEENTNKQPVEKTKSAKELLDAKDDPFYWDTTGNVNNDWAQFEDTNTKKQTKCKNANKEIGKSPKALKSSVKTDKVEESSLTKQKKSVKRKKSTTNSEETLDAKNISQGTVEHQKSEISGKNKKRKIEQADKSHITDEPVQTGTKTKKKMKKKKTQQLGEEKDSAGNQEESAQKIKNALSKRQKRNMKKRNTTENLSEENKINNIVGQSTENRNTTEQETNGSFNKHTRQPNNFNNNQNTFTNIKQNKPKKRKPPKIRDDKEHKRRKPEVPSRTLTINGIQIQIVNYDGFPIKKEDADRLKELKQQMIMKGIPKKEIDSAMKLERRKAEKALARIKKCVCFHCRKSGHNLSDCPELGSEQAGTGICFKCGSTEHTHFECKVAKAEEYRYAKCFICREQGHIAKQCPDNPKGVYPQGGACKICGDVTHLKKDCPDLAKEKEETAITVDTIENFGLESLEKGETQTNSNKQSSKTKVIKF